VSYWAEFGRQTAGAQADPFDGHEQRSRLLVRENGARAVSQGAIDLPPNLFGCRVRRPRKAVDLFEQELRGDCRQPVCLAGDHERNRPYLEGRTPTRTRDT